MRLLPGTVPSSNSLMDRTFHPLIHYWRELSFQCLFAPWPSWTRVREFSVILFFICNKLYYILFHSIKIRERKITFLFIFLVMRGGFFRGGIKFLFLHDNNNVIHVADITNNVFSLISILPQESTYINSSFYLRFFLPPSTSCNLNATQA